MSRVKKPIVALIYDFDKTLCTKDMQEYTFIPTLDMSAKTFWENSNNLAKERGMDTILAYMFTMLKEAGGKSVSVKRESFNECGREIEFFDGVEDWFDRINKYGKEHGCDVKHYIISSGLKEIIEGSRIYKEFEKVFASEYHYNVDGVAVWPAIAVNYTTKTQFLYRINKGVLDISNDNDLNKYLADSKRPVPFNHMIYIGDGLTDIPCMRVVKSSGGKSIAVYIPRNNKSKNIADSLFTDERVNYVYKADYSEGKELDKVVKLIVNKIKLDYELLRKSKIIVNKKKKP